MKNEAPGSERGAGDAMSVGEALRAVGFGERALATEMRELVVRLRSRGGSSKLLLDTLKECGRHLVAASERDEEWEGDGAVQVELVHKVARPAREKSGGKMKEREKQIGFQFEKETL